jgi:serine/threonine protein kinase
VCVGCYKSKKISNNHSYDKHPLLVEDTNSHLEIDSDNIELGKKLGEGGFGAVYLSKLKNTGELVACKVITLTSDKAKSLTLYESYLKELYAFKELKGVNILKMIGHSRKDTINAFNMMIITEFMGKGSLADVIEKEPELSWRKRLTLACGIASGMAKSKYWFYFCIKFV